MTTRAPITTTPWAANTRPVPPALAAEIIRQWQDLQTMGKR